MTQEEQALELLLKQISVVYDGRLSNLSYDTTYIGIVEKIKENNVYVVNYNGAQKEFKTKNSLSVKIGSIVHVVHPQNHVNAKFLLEDIMAASIDAESFSQVSSVNGYTGAVNLDSDYYQKPEINKMLTDIQNANAHPTYTAKPSGLYKITIDKTGHISDAIAITKSDITALGIPSNDSNIDAMYITVGASDELIIDGSI